MVFISHKQEDEKKARGISNYLKERNVNNYLDVLDPDLSTGDVTKKVVDQLRQSTHVIVVFTENTKESMWVPFELGVAYERDNGIGVYHWPENKANVAIPEYLNEFPIMSDGNDLDKFIALYSQSFESLTEENRSFSKTASAEKYSAQFISQLKQQLR